MLWTGYPLVRFKHTQISRAEAQHKTTQHIMCHQARLNQWSSVEMYMGSTFIYLRANFYSFFQGHLRHTQEHGTKPSIHTYMYLHTYIHAFIQYIHPYIHTCIHTVHTYIHIHTYMHACGPSTVSQPSKNNSEYLIPSLCSSTPHMTTACVMHMNLEMAPNFLIQKESSIVVKCHIEFLQVHIRQ